MENIFISLKSTDQTPALYAKDSYAQDAHKNTVAKPVTRSLLKLKMGQKLAMLRDR